MVIFHCYVSSPEGIRYCVLCRVPARRASTSEAHSGAGPTRRSTLSQWACIWADQSEVLAKRRQTTSQKPSEKIWKSTEHILKWSKMKCYDVAPPPPTSARKLLVLQWAAAKLPSASGNGWPVQAIHCMIIRYHLVSTLSGNGIGYRFWEWSVADGGC